MTWRKQLSKLASEINAVEEPKPPEKFKPNEEISEEYADIRVGELVTYQKGIKMLGISSEYAILIDLEVRRGKYRKPWPPVIYLGKAKFFKRADVERVRKEREPLKNMAWRQDIGFIPIRQKQG